MKNIIKSISLLLVLTLTISCDSGSGDDLGYAAQEERGWVQFLTTNPAVIGVFQGALGTIDLDVNIQVPTTSSDLTINYALQSVSGADPNNVFSNTGAIVAPAGKTSYAGPDNDTGFEYTYLAMISLNLTDLDGTTLTEPMVFDVVLTGTSSSSITAGLEGETKPVSQRIVINPSISAFEGAYTVSEVFTSGTNAGLQLAAAFGESYQVELAMVEGDSTASTMLVTNSDGFDTYYPAGTIMTFYLNGTIDLYDGANFNIPFLAGFDYHLINTTSYDFTTGIIVFSGDFGSPTNYGPYQTTLIKAVDNDNDGYYINLDCDDTNAQINPGATEIEDGIDNDCDGQIDEGFGHSGISGTWRLAPEAGALGVGPELDNISWWSNTSDDVTTRACLFDDTYVFNADGSFQNVVGSETWIETWQGAATEGCGTPVAPHDGSATATYTYDEAAGTITLDGVGAYLVLAKAINGGELASPADAPGSVTYIASLSADGLTLELDIEVAGGGHWSFKLARQ